MSPEVQIHRRQQIQRRRNGAYNKARQELSLRLLRITLLLAILSVPTIIGVAALEFDANLRGNLFVSIKQQDAQPQQAPLPEQQVLGEPQCDPPVGGEFVCDVNVLYNETTTSVPTTVIEAVLTCPLQNGAAPELSSINNPMECGCEAVVTEVVENSTRSPRECSCEWCPDDTTGGIKSLSVDCSSNLADPYALGECKAIGCGGVCLDAVGNTTATPPPTTATQEPTTVAPITNGTTTVPPTTDATMAPTTTSATPLDQRTIHWIPSAFYVTNDQQLKANDLATADQMGLNEAYMEFVAQVMEDMSGPGVADNESSAAEPPPSNSTNSTRYLMRQQRRLAPEYAPRATEIYMIQDAAACPNSAPAGVTCLIAYGRYQLLLAEEDEPTAVSNQYITATQQAIDDGKLQAKLVQVDPDNDLTVLTSTFTLTPALTAGACSLCENGEEPAMMDKQFGRNDDFTCATVVRLYSEQVPEECLNYGSIVSTEMTQQMKAISGQFPLRYQDYCQCPTSSATSISLDAITTSSTTCDAFCPTDQKVPDENVDLMADPQKGLTCGSLELFADSVNDLRMCDAMKQYGALCCSQTIIIDGNTTDPPEPTPPPTVPGTQVVTIDSTFLVYNTNGLTADVLMLGPELDSMSRSYAVFVEQVVADVQMGGGGSSSNSTGTNPPTGAPEGNSDEANTTDVPGDSPGSSNSTDTDPPAVAPAGNSTATADVPAANETRYIRTRVLQLNVQHQQEYPQQGRRRLEVTLDVSSAAVYSFNDTECPTTVPKNASCAIGYAHYDLLLVDEDNMTVAEVYTNATQDAIARGLLDETLQEVDPYTWLTVKGTADGLEPTQTVPQQEEAYDDGGYDELFMIGIGVSIAIIVVTLVAVLCASDLSGVADDDSIDPWEKDTSRSSKKTPREKAPDKNKFSPHNKDIPPRTERQEYEVYRAQVETLIEQKTPEEVENIDDLMDLFYEREQVLIATLRHLPDCTEHAEEDNIGNLNNNFNDSMDWRSFADEEDDEEEKSISSKGEEKNPEPEDDGDGDGDEEAKVDVDVEVAEDDGGGNASGKDAGEKDNELGGDPSLSRSAHTIQEGDEDEDESVAAAQEKVEEPQTDYESSAGAGETWDDEEAQEVRNEDDVEDGDDRTDDADAPAAAPAPTEAKAATEAGKEAMDESIKSGTEEWDDER